MQRDRKRFCRIFTFLCWGNRKLGSPNPGRKGEMDMKKGKIIIIGVVFLLFAVLAFHSPSVEAKVKTKKVTLKEGNNHCYFYKKVAKAKIKYSKKGIVRAKLKKDKVMGKYIQIDGKKKGTTTVTVKIYSTGKKYHTYKYKVTVTTDLDIAKSARGKAEAKKAFALQNKYRREAGAESLQWSDELYEAGLYRLKTSGFDDHKNADRDYASYFGDLYPTEGFLQEGKLDITENLAGSWTDAKEAVNEWKESPGHYRNMISERWQSGAIVKYGHAYIAVFSGWTADAMDNWRDFKKS